MTIAPIWNTSTLSKALRVEVPSGIVTSVVQFNSNDVEPGDLFIALRGQSDGHIYAKDALERGAGAVIIDHECGIGHAHNVIMIDDSWRALEKLAHYKRATTKARIIGVTGSVGKTSTKEVLYNILSEFGLTFASRKSFNNYIGVPINLASMPDDIEYAIFEIGMSFAGEIRRLAKLVQPEIALITNIFPTHIENFDSMLELASAKCEIFDMIDNVSSLILNKDNEYYEYCKSRAHGLNVYHFGENNDAHARMINYSFDDVKSHAKLLFFQDELSFSTRLVGKHMSANILASLLVVKTLGLDVSKAISRVSELSPIDGRGRVIDIDISGHDCKIIYDCYNASPASMQASLEHLRDITSHNKMVVLADMQELGDNSVNYHRELAPFVIASGAKYIYTIGKFMHFLHLILKEKITSIHFDNIDDIRNAIPKLIHEESVILFKGSNVMGLSRIVEELIGQK